MSQTESREQRGAVRFDAALPVEIDGQPGRILNVSASGAYFETEVRHQVGDRVELTVQVTEGGRPRRLRFGGEVVRVEGDGARIRVAAVLDQPFFSGTEVVEVSGTSASG